MANEEPFILSKRKNSPYYQVRFKNPDKTSSVRFFPAKSTKETVKSKAIAKAWSMYNQEKVESLSVVHSDILDSDAVRLLENLKRRGVISNYTLPEDRSSISLVSFLKDFWTLDLSPYLAEKKRLGQHLGLTYINESKKLIERYWSVYFDEKMTLSEVTRTMLKDFIKYVDTFSFSWNRKLKIFRAGSIALKWAFNDEMIDRDITAGLASFSGKSKERNILTKEMAELLFTTKWEDERCKMINLIAMLTGMRVGEIVALRKMDLGENCLYVNHSWNRTEGLKSPKNGEARVVYFPFPQITAELMKLADLNGGDLEALIFSGAIINTQPMDIKLPNKRLHEQLIKIGLTKEESKKYCFHSWRHFYATYMSDKVNQRALQSQTGHKTVVMLEHYSSHQIDSDITAIESAQMEIFGSIVKKCGY